MNRVALRLIGATFWAALLIAGWNATHTSRTGHGSPTVSALDYLAGRTEKIRAIDDTRSVQLGEPVFLLQADDRWIQVAHVTQVQRQDPRSVELDWYGPDLSNLNVNLVAYRSSGQLDEVVATMLPPSKRREIQVKLEVAFRAHGDEIMRGLAPLVQESLQQSLPVIEEGLRESVQRHRPEIDALVGRLNEELVEDRLVPLAQREVVPIVRKHGQPIAETIGRELWDRASLWRFGWRAAYDRSPLPQRNLLQREWDRFVEDEAIPVFDQHMDEIAVAVQKTIADIANNDAVRDELASVANSLARDPETLRIVRKLLKESIVDNPQLHDVWRRVWTSEQAQSALDVAGDRLEPVVREIGDDLFGSREDGINPDFARVLRNQILGKDRRWIVAIPSEVLQEPSEVVTIQRSEERMSFPIVYLANEEVDPYADSANSRNADAGKSPSAGADE